MPELNQYAGKTAVHHQTVSLGKQVVATTSQCTVVRCKLTGGLRRRASPVVARSERES